MDHGRWRLSKAAEQARGNFVQILKDVDISDNEDNWSKWDSYFHTLMESLELLAYVFGDVQPPPVCHVDLMASQANGDAVFYAEHIVPEMFQDLLGRIFLRNEDMRGVEIIHEEEKRRFDAARFFSFL